MLRTIRTFRRTVLPACLTTAACLVLPLAAVAQPATTYEVTITNLSESQPITPPVVATHQINVHLFVPGLPAPEALVPLAEDGDPTDLVELLEGLPEVLDVAVGDGPIPPGGSTTVEVEARGKWVFLSAVGMLATTNDAFFGLDHHYLIGNPWTRSVEVPAYDAGSEEDNELCDFIPGPPCDSPGVRATDEAEGFVHVHSGIHGIGDLASEEWTWNGPVVRVDIVRQPRQRGGNGNGKS